MIQGVVNRFEAIHDRREAEIHGRGANRKLDGKWYVMRTIISDKRQGKMEHNYASDFSLGMGMIDRKLA